MSEADRYSPSQSSSNERGSNDDPFGSYLRNGKSQVMVQNEITTAGNDCTLAEINQESTMNEMTLFTCDHCPYRTKYKWEFKKHLNRHVGSTKPCKDCNMPFKSLSHLNRHRKAVHGAVLSERIRSQYCCDMCPYVSAYSTDMRRHKVRHLAEGGYHCKHCNYPFIKLYKMLNHVRKIHGSLDVNGERKIRPEKCTDDQSLIEGINQAKETLLRRNELIINVNNSVNLNKRLVNQLQHSDQLRNGKPHDSDKMESHVTERSCKRSQSILNCAFCGHVATSYASLKEHLDAHDDETVDHETNDDLFVSHKNSPDSLFVHRSVDDVDQREELIDIDNTNNKIVDLDTNINAETNADTDIATRCSDLQEKMDITDQENIFENISDVEQDYKDALDIYDECVSKITKDFEDEFILRPFACTKCYFTTGNIDRLKIHVETHFYEKAREAYSLAHRGSVEEQNGTSEYVLNKVTGSHNENTIHRIFPHPWNRGMEIDNAERFAIDSSDPEVENNVSNIENDDNVIEDTDEGFCDKDSECKQNRCTESEKEDEKQSLNYIGRLSKVEFKKNKQLYKILNDEEMHVVYECLVCEYDYHFQNMDLLKEHFKQKHLDLREKICMTCKHCSRPFP